LRKKFTKFFIPKLAFYDDPVFSCSERKTTYVISFSNINNQAQAFRCDFAHEPPGQMRASDEDTMRQSARKSIFESEINDYTLNRHPSSRLGGLEKNSPPAEGSGAGLSAPERAGKLSPICRSAG